MRAKRRVLLADDDDVTRAVLGAMLQLLNYEVDNAADGCEVVQITSKRRYDVIITDLMMDPMDGVTASLFVRLKEQGMRRRTPIVALTAYSVDECSEQCVAAGIDACLAKPVDLKELLLLVENVLATSDAEASVVGKRLPRV